MLFGVLSIALMNIYVIAKADDYIITPEQAKEKNADCIIVLGSLVHGDNTLSDILEDRVKTGIALYNNGVSDKILMSGDNGRVNYNEVDAMKRYAVARGVDAEDIHTDHAGFSTYDTMYRARDVFEAKTVIIVTQKFHLSRAVFIARSLGLDAYGVESDLRTYTSESYNNLRELAARVKSVYSVIVMPEPKYLGDVIPISGKASSVEDIIDESGKQ